MSLSDRLKANLSKIAAAVMVVSLFATTPAFAATTHNCQEALEDHQVSDGDWDDVRMQGGNACCAQMHCCPILPEPPLVSSPNAPIGPLHARVRLEQPLLLLSAIDPPPRSPSE